MAFKLLSVVGARPNFIKIAPICEAVRLVNAAGDTERIQHVLVHTGQQYDNNLSDSFFNDLELPKPDVCLGIESGSHSVQTARIMERFENVIVDKKPNVVLVVGDVNLTAACALVAKKTVCWTDRGSLPVFPKVAHVEAGLRSFDRSMPEEINRLVTDCISDYLFTTEESANRNLLREGIEESRIFFVGNVIIDTLLRHRAKAQDSTIVQDLQLADGRGVKPYAILTLQRPANVDDKRVFAQLLDAFLEVSKQMPIIFPAHPRTLRRIQDDDLGDYFVDHFVQWPEPWDSRVRIRLVPPLGYLDFLNLMSTAKVVLTDSGGIQEETTILGVPCITLRENTERPITVDHGTNVLVGSNAQKIVSEFNRVLLHPRNPPPAPPFWDGQASKRIVQILLDDFYPADPAGNRNQIVHAGLRESVQN